MQNWRSPLFIILGILFQSAKDCNILSYCVQVQSISVLIASLRQLWGSQTGHSSSDPSSLNSTILTIYILNNTNRFTPVSYNIHCYSGWLWHLLSQTTLSLCCGRAFLWTSRLMKTQDRLFSCRRKHKPQPIVSSWHSLEFFNEPRDFF